MVALDFTLVGEWTGGGTLTTWNNHLVNKWPFDSTTTTFEMVLYGDTGFPAINIIQPSGLVDFNQRYAVGDDTYIYLLSDNEQDIHRVGLDLSNVDIGDQPPGGVNWGMSNAKGSKIVCNYTLSLSPGITLCTYDKVTGANPTDIATDTLNTGMDFFDVDPDTDDIYIESFIPQVGVDDRSIRKYDISGNLIWETFLPTERDTGTPSISGIAVTPIGIMVYSVDNDNVPPPRINNNWWLLDKTNGDIELMEVTIDGMDWMAWDAITGNAIFNSTQTLVYLDGNIYFRAESNAPNPSWPVYGAVLPALGTGFVKKMSAITKTVSLFAGSTIEGGDEDGPAIGTALFTEPGEIAYTWDGVQRPLYNSGNRFYVIDNGKIRMIHLCEDEIDPA